MSSPHGTSVTGWIAFLLVRLVILFYAMVVLLGSGLLELLVSRCARKDDPALMNG